MRIDVPTLYYLIAGTTLMAACLTVWERRLNGGHRQALGLWAAGYVLVGAGCLARVFHAALPGFLAIGFSNLAVVFGYGALAAGAVRFSGGRIPRAALAAGLLAGAAWLLWGQHAPIGARIVIVSVAIAALCAATAATLRVRNGETALPSQRLALSIFALHALFFLGRAVAVSAGIEGDIHFEGTDITLTMFESILWSALAPMVLLVLTREKTEKALVAASGTDFLTGLDNRRAFARKADLMLGEGGREGARLALLLFDLDHFKSINDRYGHQTGDEVLKLFAAILQSETLPRDAVARLGGEEFAVLIVALAGRAEAIAAAVAQRFREATGRMAGMRSAASVSAGLAWTGADAATLDRLLAAADGALYRAKANGRDRLECAPAVGPGEDGRARAA